MQLHEANDARKQDQYSSNVASMLSLVAWTTWYVSLQLKTVDVTDLDCLHDYTARPRRDALANGKTIMVGIDVIHPGRAERTIAAVVASVGKIFVQFPASLRIQETKKEVFILFPILWKEIWTLTIPCICQRCWMIKLNERKKLDDFEIVNFRQTATRTDQQSPLEMLVGLQF